MLEPSLEELLHSSFEANMIYMQFALPARIINTRGDGVDMTVDVEPVINLIYKNGVSEPRPPILNVPLSFPTSRTAGMTFEVNSGDTGMLIFSQRSLDVWKRGDGSPVNPNDQRMFDIRDAVFYIGLNPLNMSVNRPSRHTNNHDPKDTVMYAGLGTGNEVEVRLKRSGELVINAPMKVTVNTTSAEVNASERVTIDSPETEMTGNLKVVGSIAFGNGIQGQGGTKGNAITGDITHTNGSLSSNGIVLDKHTHGGVQQGGSSTSAPQ